MGQNRGRRPVALLPACRWRRQSVPADHVRSLESRRRVQASGPATESRRRDQSECADGSPPNGIACDEYLQSSFVCPETDAPFSMAGRMKNGEIETVDLQHIAVAQKAVYLDRRERLTIDEGRGPIVVAVLDPLP